MARTGRKRKPGARHPNGQLTAAARASAEPGPTAEMRAIRERLFPGRQRGEITDPLDVLAARGEITPDQRDAGRLYRHARERVFGRAGVGEGPLAQNLPNAPHGHIDEAEAIRRQGAYDLASKRLMLMATRRAYLAVLDVVITRHPCPPDRLDDLRAGLDVLAHHYGLDASSKSAQKTHEMHSR